METRRVGNECVKEKLSRLSIHPPIPLSNLCYCFPSHRKYWKSILSLGLIPLHPRGLSRCVVSLCSCGPFEFFLFKKVLFVMIKQKCFTAVLPAFPFSTCIQSHGRVKFPSCYYRAYFVLTVSAWANSITSMEALLLMVHHSSYIRAHCIIIYI